MPIQIKTSTSYTPNGFVYQQSGKTIKGEIYSFYTYEETTNNIAYIIENYRIHLKEGRFLASDVLFERSQPLFNAFLDRVENPFNTFNFDTFFVFFPSDSNRLNLLRRFARKLLNSIRDWESKDRSGLFKKIDPNKSITEMEENFLLLKTDKILPIKRLLIIDDVFNEGRTINKLFDLLLGSGKISESTEVKLICIYTFNTLPDNYKNVLDKYKNSQITTKNNG